jgi:hypothetical protein
MFRDKVAYMKDLQLGGGQDLLSQGGAYRVKGASGATNCGATNYLRNAIVDEEGKS